mgnify:CR=1 FL=1
MIAPGAFIGALVGAIIGYLDGAFVAGIVEGKLRALDKSETAEARAEFERKIKVLRLAIFVLSTGGIAAVGYFFGRSLGG